jgi:hypothetical protein
LKKAIKNEVRKFFNETKKLKQKYCELPPICKDENDTILTQTEQILIRWRIYFCKILQCNVDKQSDSTIMSVNMTVNNPEIEISPPTYNEVCTIINKLKNNKAGGTDNIISELIKQG